MRKSFTITVCLISLLLLAPLGLVAKSQTSDSERLIQAARFLEQKPLDKDAKKIRGWAVEWLTATDKVNVKICSLLLSGFEKKYKYSGELLVQYTIGMGAYKLANPDKAQDEDAAQQAGIESALTSYEALVTEQPKARHAFMDDLLAKRGQGSLAAYVKENNCKDKN